jgi:predicted Na+-dependent transporter
MNIKRIFGALLTLLGIASLIYAAQVFLSATESTRDIKTLIIYGVLGIIFFASGISLVRATKDES